MRKFPIIMRNLEKYIFLYFLGYAVLSFTLPQINASQSHKCDTFNNFLFLSVGQFMLQL
jgi:hypothetical protein